MSITHPLRIWVNGARRDLDIETNVTLLELIRDVLDLTGTKVNCEQGECGACTVLLDGDAVDACLVLAVSAQDTRVTTIEGLGGGNGSDEVQRAFVEYDAAQCGYCTPGMVMAATALLSQARTEGRTLTRGDIVKGLEGNYCRCTGYEPIIGAIEQLSDRGPRG